MAFHIILEVVTEHWTKSGLLMLDLNLKDLHWHKRTDKNGTLLSKTERQFLNNIMNDHGLMPDYCCLWSGLSGTNLCFFTLFSKYRKALHFASLHFCIFFFLYWNCHWFYCIYTNFKRVTSFPIIGSLPCGLAVKIKIQVQKITKNK